MPWVGWGAGFGAVLVDGAVAAADEVGELVQRGQLPGPGCSMRAGRGESMTKLGGRAGCKIAS